VLVLLPRLQCRNPNAYPAAATPAPAYATPVQACFAVGVSGSISCVIGDAGLLSYEGRAREPFIFGRSDDGQNYTEGIVIAALALCCGALAFSMLYVSTLPIYFGRDLLVLLAISLFVVAAVNIYEPFALETSYYRMERVLPFELWAWLAAPVKRSSGLLKRVARLAGFALGECNSFDEFANKVQTLLVAYLKRSYSFLPQ
jgi:hypothetical protein